MPFFLSYDLFLLQKILILSYYYSIICRRVCISGVVDSVQYFFPMTSLTFLMAIRASDLYFWRYVKEKRNLRACCDTSLGAAGAQSERRMNPATGSQRSTSLRAMREMSSWPSSIAVTSSEFGLVVHVLDRELLFCSKHPEKFLRDGREEFSPIIDN